MNASYRSALVPAITFGDTELIDMARNGPRHLENLIPLHRTIVPDGFRLASLRLKRLPLYTIGM